MWLGRRQQAAIDYLREENRVLREKLGPRRIRFTEAQRRRLGEAGKQLGRKGLAGVAAAAALADGAHVLLHGPLADLDAELQELAPDSFGPPQERDPGNAMGSNRGAKSWFTTNATRYAEPQIVNKMA